MLFDRDTVQDQHRRGQRPPLPKRPVVNPNSKQAELLASVASEMNTFSNDGSFMATFEASQGREASEQNGRSMADGAEASSGVIIAQNAVCRQLPLTCNPGAVSSSSSSSCTQLTCSAENTCRTSYMPAGPTALQ